MTNDTSHERIVRIDTPAKHFVLLTAPDGNYLGVDDGQVLATYADADDQVIWEHGVSADTYRHVVSGLTLTAQRTTNTTLCHLQRDGAWLGHDGAPAKERASFNAEHGPARLPSDYLKEFTQNGWVCLEAVLSPAIIDELERISGTGRYSDQRYDRAMPPLLQSAAVAKVAAEPVSLWMMRQYMHVNDIRLAHSPSLAVLSPDDGKRDVQGWHSDFPYLWGITGRVGGDRIPTKQSGQLVLGIQRNICISPFTKANGATCFKLGTHSLNEGPPEAWGTGTAYSRPGYRQEHGLPYQGPDADVIEAPAGSIILYDARTWHRAGVNRSNETRAAMLQAVTPAYIMPFIDTSKVYKAFAGSELAQQLTHRERQEVQRLLVHKIVGPMGQMAIGVDAELTELTAAARTQPTSGY